MSVNALQGMGAYARAAGRPVAASIGDDAGTISATGVASGGNFANLISSIASDAVTSMKKSETVSRQAVTGKADLVDVVRSVNEAEMAMETFVAVRDRMVKAYEQVMQMPI